eukprot:TRINITY_DN321_c0_g1_i9.p1 TRINITY_DN321_c0_g1~~TRINITY_DN321_c0_g1_i9.p1  ORF type:complete len:290 (-),score=76.44 TRINITY_DN321_c0_g1_i9:329-1198(-)
MEQTQLEIEIAPGAKNMDCKAPAMASVVRTNADDLVVLPVEDVSFGPIPCISILGTAVCPCWWLCGTGCFCLEPREEAALMHCGVLTSMEKEPGCHCTVPCGFEMRSISTKQCVCELPSQKVADGNGNPINVSAVLNYRVSDSKKAIMNVQDVDSFVNTNAQATLKQTVGRYSYDQLKALSEEVNSTMKSNLIPLVECAGVEVSSMRLNDLAYAPEVAAAMLKIQQARALVQARELIVEGAVRIAQDAVTKLEQENVIDLDPVTKTTIVTNILTVTCGESNAVPTVALK